VVLKQTLSSLYNGDSTAALRFRFALLAFDLLTIGFFVVSSMMQPNLMIYAIDYLIAFVICADFLARVYLESNRKLLVARLDTWLDIVVILSLFASMFVDNLSFLRVIRTLRLLRSYRVMRDLRNRSNWFKAHQDVIESTLNLFIFIFFITACVFVAEGGENPKINNYMDALYFTITTLTTTGFGDITMQDTSGRMLAVVIMVVGVSLFLRLVQTIFRPSKVLYKCPDCGLMRHDHDAVHCKHCGRVLPIESDGF